MDWSELRHYHYDVFEWCPPFFDMRMKARFQVGDQGEVDAVSIPIEPAVENVTFTRKPPELTGELAGQLVGSYDSAIEGLSFAVTEHAGKIYAAQTGSAPEEITPYRIGEEVVAFRSKRARFEFVREGGAIVRLVLKTPDITLEALRRASSGADGD